MTKNSRKSADVVPKVYKNAQMWGGAPPPRAAGGEEGFGRGFKQPQQGIGLSDLREVGEHALISRGDLGARRFEIAE